MLAKDKSSSSDRLRDVFGGSSPLTAATHSSVPAASSSGSRSPEMTTIERIMFKARQKARQDEKDREAKEAAKWGSSFDDPYEILDDSGDEELPDLDSDGPLGPLTTIPAMREASERLHSDKLTSRASRVLPDATPSTTRKCEEAKADDQSPSSYSPDTTTGRPRRSTARTLPYRYTTDLERPSTRRQKINNALQSAAVKANIVKLEDYSSGGRRNEGKSSDVIAKMLREKKAREKKGISGAALQEKLDMMELGQKLLMEDTEAAMKKEADAQRSDSSNTSSSDSDRSSDDDSGSSSRRWKRTKLDGWKKEIGFDAVALALTRDLSVGDEAGQDVIDILKSDYDLASVSLTGHENVGLSGRSFWRDDRVRILRAESRPIELKHGKTLHPSTISSEADDEGPYTVADRDLSDHLAGYLYRIQVLGADVKRLCGEASYRTFVPWLTEQAVMSKSEQNAQAAMRILFEVVERKADLSIPLVLPCLAVALAKLGAKKDAMAPLDVVQDGFKVPWSVRPPIPLSSSSGYPLRSRERLRLTSRIVDICAAVARALFKSVKATVRMCQPVFFWLLAISVDSRHKTLRATIAQALSDMLKRMFQESNKLKVDEALCDRMEDDLRDTACTTQLAYLRAMPDDSLRARALTCNVAMRLTTSRRPAKDGETTSMTYSIITPTFDPLLEILSAKDHRVNPLWAPRGPEADFVQLEACVDIVQFCFTDLMLQLSSLSRPAGVVEKDMQRRTYTRYAQLGLDAVLHKDNSISDLLAAQAAKYGDNRVRLFPGRSTEPPPSKPGQVKMAVNLLHDLAARVSDSRSTGGRANGGALAGMAASESQTRAKDALQRSAMLLHAFLLQYGFVIERTLAGQAEMERSAMAQTKLTGFGAPSPSVRHVLIKEADVPSAAASRDKS